MKISLADYLRTIEPDLGEQLVSPQFLSKIQHLSGSLPPLSLFCFELRLGNNDTVDFQVGLPRLPVTFCDRFLEHPTWQDLDRFCRQWAESDTFLNRSIDRVGLEFDMERSSAVPIPCLFADLNWEALEAGAKLPELLQYWPFNPNIPQLKTNIERCIASLPEGANIQYLGAMLSRTAPGIRTIVKGIPPRQVLDYLHTIGWGEPQPSLVRFVNRLADRFDRISLALDVGEIIYPRLGLECSPGVTSFQEAKWKPLLEHLEAENLCSAPKKDALLTWPGMVGEADRPELWPENLVEIDRFLGEEFVSFFARQINHVKVVCQPEGPVEAKAYLTAKHHWFDRDELTWFNKTQPPESQVVAENNEEYVRQVGSYYDRIQPFLGKSSVTTYQFGVLKSDSKTDTYRNSNLYFGQRAGIQPGHRVLDAGCGVCGPSIDIATSIEDITIDAVTVSPEQAETAKQRIKQAGLEHRIRVSIVDYHDLQFADNTFDVAFFFESFGYAYDIKGALQGVYRVLRPGGKLYIKDIFCKESSLCKREQEALEEFNRVYLYKTSRPSQIANVARSIGFNRVAIDDISSITSSDPTNEAMVEYCNGIPTLTDLGKFYYYHFSPSLPIRVCEVEAFK